MKVKESLYEKFKEESDPIKDMGIGIKSLDDYIEKRLAAKGMSVNYHDNDFWTFVYDFTDDKYDKDALIEIILSMLEDIPLKNQIKFMEEYVDNYIEKYGK